MQRRILAALLCAILIMALLPAAALAADYSSWEDAIAAGGDLTGKTITIGGKDYKYGGDLTDGVTLEIQLGLVNENTVYKAKDGKVLWEQTVEVEGGFTTVKGGKFTMDNAEITRTNPTPVFKLAPGSIEFILKGENKIGCFYDGTEHGCTAFNSSEAPSVIKLTGAGTIDVAADGTIIKSNGMCSVTLEGGERWGTIIANDVVLNNVTIPQNRELNLQGVTGTVSAANTINNDTLRLKAGTTVDAINTLGLTGSGIVQVGDSRFLYVGGKWVAYGSDVSNSELNLNDLPSVKTAYRAGDGTIVFTPAAEGGNPTLTLNNATNDNGIKLKGSSTLALNGTNSTDSIIVHQSDGLGTGSLTITAAEGASLNAHYISADSITGNIAALNTLASTGDGSIFYGSYTIPPSVIAASSIAVDAGATVTVDGDNVVFKSETPTCTFTNNGKIIINSDKKLDLSACTTVAGTGSIKNSGVLILPDGTTGEQIRALNITGDGVVEVGSETYTNDGGKLHKYQMLNFNTRLYQKEGDESPKKLPDSTDVAADGYKFEGDSTNGYKITLGNLLIEPLGDDPQAITLPDDGNVTVYLENATTTRITGSGAGITCGGTHTVTINGTGNLEILVTSAQGAIKADGKLIIEGGNITVKNDSGGGIVISGYAESSEKTVNITGGKLSITGKESAIQASDNIIIGSGMRITDPKNAKIGPFVDIGYTVLVDDSVAASVTIEPAPSGADSDYTPSPVTVYNDPSVPDATVWLTGSGLGGSDLLVTKRNPKGSAYEALLKLADSDDVFATYNIYLRSGKKSTGFAMDLTFDLNSRYASQDFTLVHQKADSTYEYFYDTASANGDLTFGPLYELSPFMLVKGTLTPASMANVVDIPKTGDNTQPGSWAGIALLAFAGFTASLVLARRKRQNG